MALQPFREALAQAGLRAFQNESSFKPEADAALAGFQAQRDELGRQVKRGDLTVKVAREKALAAAVQFKVSLRQRADHYSAVPRVFLDRLVEAGNARKRALEHLSTDGLQRETNRLLRKSLLEQQVVNRGREFEGKAFVRTLTSGLPVPTLDGLLGFHETSGLAGDEAAVEWARRQLESMRGRVVDPADLRRIDLACDRPDVVNPRLVASYMQAVRAGDPGSTEGFVSNALESGDANASVAAFLLAREEPGGTAVRWVRNVLDALKSFPDAALSTLRSIEAEARQSDAEASHAQVDFAGAVVDAQVRLSGVEPPTDAELARQGRIRARPVAKLGEPIGLALDRRGFQPDEFNALAGVGDEPL